MDDMSDHDHEHEKDSHPPTAEDLIVREHSLDLAKVREKLQAGSGKQYWRTLEELAEDPHFEDLLHREFPRAASQWDESVDRRDFLKLMAASLALAGISGCRKPIDYHILPYVRQPDGLVLGKPQYYATAMPFGADALGLLVESHEGRPTKIEGNPDHPGSLGGTDVFAQASVLNLYDPDRARTPAYLGDITTWSAFQNAAKDLATSQKAVNGAGLRILTGKITSPVLAAQMNGILKTFPQAKWHQWEPAANDGAYEGAKLAFGRYVNTVLQPGKANVILSLDSDFIASGPGHVRYMKDFYKRRNLTGPNDEMNRLYVVEPTPSVTGASADHRLPLKFAEVGVFARALAAKLGLGGSVDVPPAAQGWLDAVVKDLQAHRGASLVVAGEQQPAEVHALVHAVNAALGNVGATLYYTESVEANPVNCLESLRDLCSDLYYGKVDALLILGCNPVYDAPHDFDFVSKIYDVDKKAPKVHTIVHVSSHFNETSEYAHWHIPESHYLESWDEARAFDGTLSVVQPLIAPLYESQSPFAVLAALTDKPGVSSCDAIREHLKTVLGEGDVEENWRKTLNDGVVAKTAFPPLSISPKFDAASLPPVRASAADELEFIFRPDPSIHDGRFANNGWLQELPKPVTKLTWDNAAMVSPNTAQKLGASQKIMFRGGEHGNVRCSLADISLSKSKATAAVWMVPGQADGVVVLPLGYGRRNAGFTGNNKGFDAYAVRTSEAFWYATGGKLTLTGDDYPLACTQYHHNMEGRKILATGTLQEFRQNPAFAHEGDETPPKSESLYPPFEPLGFYQNYKWGMAIDLTKCNSCNACVIACQSENNIPVVGKDQVMRGREMHWIRIDRYYETGPTQADTSEEIPGLANPPTFFQPVPCMQCENAHCEQVCPVGATVHSAEGLNDMVYNRCIGTRYCSNNCPYKVRRFNFLRFQDWGDTPQLKLVRNPEVTVRSRGVMEKCTYCVQRINNGRIEAEKQNRRIRDGEIQPACQQVCPSDAIIFGNLNDPESRVARLKAQSRNYHMMGELNSRARTTYLAAVRNPNPELEKA